MNKQEAQQRKDTVLLEMFEHFVANLLSSSFVGHLLHTNRNPVTFDDAVMRTKGAADCAVALRLLSTRVSLDSIRSTGLYTDALFTDLVSAGYYDLEKILG